MKKLRSRARLALDIVRRRGVAGLVNVVQAAYSLAAEPDVVPGGPLYVKGEPCWKFHQSHLDRTFKHPYCDDWTW